MPLFIDTHIIEDSEITKLSSHQSPLNDIKLKNMFGVQNLGFFLNLPDRKVFRLMRAPNKKALADCHLYAHGTEPCNLTQISHEIDFNSIIGAIDKNKNEGTIRPFTEFDTGYRTLMMLSFLDLTEKYKRYDEIFQYIKEHKGRVIDQPNDNLLAYFNYSTDAFSCGLAVCRLLKDIMLKTEYTMALVTDRPNDINESDFFWEAHKKLQMLCILGNSGKVLVDMCTKKILKENFVSSDKEKMFIKLITDEDITLFKALWEIIESQISNSDFKSDNLNNLLGYSKTQTYRKIKASTGMAPNEFITEIRLRLSLMALKQKVKTVSEIAYDLGFNSPSYFTRVFKKRYDMTPTFFTKLIEQ